MNVNNKTTTITRTTVHTAKAYYPDVVGFTQQGVDKLCVGEVLQQSDVYFSRLLIQKLVRPEIDFFF